MALSVVSKRYTGKPGVTSFLLRLFSLGKKGPFAYKFSDGYEFQPYPRSALIPDWSCILRGCSDVTGTKFQKYVEALGFKGPSLNSLELGSTFTARAGDPALASITDYDGPLTSDPDKWPEPYRSAYVAGHPKGRK